jgi:hypothetical protein
MSFKHAQAELIIHRRPAGRRARSRPRGGPRPRPARSGYRSVRSQRYPRVRVRRETTPAAFPPAWPTAGDGPAGSCPPAFGSRSLWPVLSWLSHGHRLPLVGSAGLHPRTPGGSGSMPDLSRRNLIRGAAAVTGAAVVASVAPATGALAAPAPKLHPGHHRFRRERRPVRPRPAAGTGPRDHGRVLPGGVAGSPAAAGRPGLPGAAAADLSVDPGRLGDLGGLRPHLGHPVPGEVDRGPRQAGHLPEHQRLAPQRLR